MSSRRPSNIYEYTTDEGRRWRVVFDAGPDPETGKRRQRQKRGFTRESDAKRWLRAQQADIDDGAFIEADRLTVREYLVNEWLPSIKARSAEDARRHRGTVSPATWESYRGSLDRYVIPRLGAAKLQALTPADLDALYDHLEAEGGQGGGPLKAKTVANTAGIMHKALSDAVKRGRMKRNPADAINPPTAGKARTEWWSVEELRSFLRHVEGDELYAAWLTFATTGARLGEVAGLTWEDLDLEAGWMRVDWTLGHVGHTMTWKPRPKSKAGERAMALDPATVAALREHKRHQAEARLLVGPAWQDGFTDHQGLTRTGLVWTYPDGAPIHPKTISNRFLKLSKDAGLPRIRLHDVRHSYASAALEAATGWHDVKVISQRLGHANVAITLDTYSHVLPAADEHLAHTLANVILGE